MNRLYAGISAVALATIVGGTFVWTTLQSDHDCGGIVIAGGSDVIGGPFELLNGDGRTVTDRDVITGPTLVYFGYTFCPDVCPLDVARNAIAIDILEEEGFEVKPVFISIDPERDTPEVVASYAADMHPSMVGLTGSPEQIADVAQTYRTTYSRGTGEGEFYLMNHQAFSYLMMPETGLATVFSRTVPAEEIARETICYINAA